MTGGARTPIVAVLGASGLIGEALCSFLISKGYEVVPMARRFTPVQEAVWHGRSVRSPLVDADAKSLRASIAATNADVVVNCIGVLQDAPGSSAANANYDFVARLVGVLTNEKHSPLLVHVSIPGQPEDDRTHFSRGKRDAEVTITGSGLSHVILRPGFILADAAYGGSALMRALGSGPIDVSVAI